MSIHKISEMSFDELYGNQSREQILAQKEQIITKALTDIIFPEGFFLLLPAESDKTNNKINFIGNIEIPTSQIPAIIGIQIAETQYQEANQLIEVLRGQLRQKLLQLLESIDEETIQQFQINSQQLKQTLKESHPLIDIKYYELKSIFRGQVTNIPKIIINPSDEYILYLAKQWENTQDKKNHPFKWLVLLQILEQLEYYTIHLESVPNTLKTTLHHLKALLKKHRKTIKKQSKKFNDPLTKEGLEILNTL